ncbi:hypothetical protein OG323_06350 [Streptomyces cyaneofuscatus]|uniref:hypothetical protein n=1 Tax=Streptomyces cyaneofuscatus TaxID=66883 RepID=UPI00386A23CE|nr:hypothetical protein OG323_06350 [Streptomyces cyaneofuscatus]
MPTSPTPDRPADLLRAAAVWVDGDPLMEAMAAAVYEQCRTEPSIVVDDPRNIAAVAATVARQLLGTTEACPECGTSGACNGGPCPLTAAEPGCAMPGFVGCECDHVTGCQHPATATAAAPEPDTGLRDRIAAVLWPLTDWDGDELNAVAAADAVMPVVTDRLRRNWGEMRDRVAELEVEAQRLATAAAPPAPADRAAALREAADAVDNTEFPDEYVDLFDNGARWAGRLLRRLAGEAAAGVQQTTEGEPEAQQAAVVQAIRDFQFDNYGLDTVDPNSEYAEWVGDLASVIVGALPAAPAVPEERP